MELLYQLRVAGFHAEGYTEDITIIVYGKFEGIVSEKVQVRLKFVQRWCQKEGLPVNSRKTTMVTFISRKKLVKLWYPAIFDSKMLLSVEMLL